MGRSPGEARREVEQAREQLGATVEEIAYKVNAPRRTKDRLADGIRRLLRLPASG